MVFFFPFRRIHKQQQTFVHNVTRTPSAGTLGIGEEATLTVHFSRKVRDSATKLLCHRLDFLRALPSAPAP